MSRVINPIEVAASLKDFWSPRIVAEVNDSFAKVAKIKGEFPWHSHEHEDEMFMVLDGEMHIEMKDQTVCLQVGQVFVVPKGVQHRPFAERECLIMLFEPKSTEHMGGIVKECTKTLAQQRSQE
jgi:mannose-6-phosphate isomerase-like protein (cupin superfamily)